MIHVCDNFFPDPFEIRKVALKSKYTYNTDNKTSWPGFRCSTIPESITDHVLSGAKHYTQNPSLKLGVPSSFQYVTGDCKWSFSYRWVGFIYLYGLSVFIFS